jgi:hypothetical protein
VFNPSSTSVFISVHCSGIKRDGQSDEHKVTIRRSLFLVDITSTKERLITRILFSNVQGVPKETQHVQIPSPFFLCIRT